MRIDLHVHSDRSDGTDPPAQLVRAAAAAGLDVISLTDHDTFDGWEEAGSEGERLGLRVVPGVEMSCRLGGGSVHLLAYDPAPDDPALLAELARIREGRAGRIPAMVEALQGAGLELAVDDVAEVVGESTPGRPHVADALAAKGYARDRRDAFDLWLTEGKPGFVTRYAPEPHLAVDLVLAAGGVPVLAHPRGRASREELSDEVIAGLAAAGLVGLEVDHLDHDPATRAELRALARDLDLVVTGASDYHGAGKEGYDLGCETTDPEQFERLLA